MCMRVYALQLEQMHNTFVFMLGRVILLVQYWWYLSQAMAATKWMLARAVVKPWKP